MLYYYLFCHKMSFILDEIDPTSEGCNLIILKLMQYEKIWFSIIVEFDSIFYDNWVKILIFQ